MEREDKLNAMNEKMTGEVLSAFEEASGSDAKVIVYTGKGEAFSSGADIHYFEDLLEDPTQWEEAIGGREDLEVMANTPQPSIAKINGDAIGIGFTMALSCDIAIASEDAALGDPHLSFGFVPSTSTVLLPLLANVQKAKEILLTGKLFSGEEAEEMGLVNYAVPSEELDDKVDEIVEELVQKPKKAMKWAKLSLNNWLMHGIDVSLKLTARPLEVLSAQKEDHRERVKAWLEAQK